ncbi:MAG: CBS domain-containing protein [Cohaesibacter sp.]|nr:CBS domain-containing protein [Cohaesibacter sp.]
MAPISYQGPRAKGKGRDSHSQTSKLAYEKVQSQTTVAHILADKGVAVYTITETTSIAAACADLSVKRIGVLPVIDSKGALVGVLSERDIIRAMSGCDGEEGVRALMADQVQTIMTPSPITCTAEDKVSSIMETMTEKRFRHMPVMQGDMLCGLVSITDLVNSRLTELELETLKIKQLMVG